MAAWFRKRGLVRVTELDWWEETEVRNQHGRGGGDHTGSGAALVTAWGGDDRTSLWGGYLVRLGKRQIYFAGDTGYPAAFRQIGQRFPGIDYALLPIGAYEPRWFMCAQHMNPEDAARGVS